MPHVLSLRNAFALALFLLTALPAFSQEQPGGPSLNAASYNDSLWSGSTKDDDGFYYRSVPFASETGSRLYIYYSAFGPSYQDLCLTITDAEGNEKRYGSKLLLGKRSGSIELDTTLPSGGDREVKLTTLKAGQTMSYTAMIYYASPAAMEFKNEADFCWKIGYLLKHSDNGFQFIRSGKGSGGLFSNFPTSAPMMAASPASSYIVDGIGSIYYESVLGRGTKAEAEAYLAQMETGLKQCMGTLFTYETKTAENGTKTFTCTNASSTEGAVIRNLVYESKTNETVPKYVVTVSMVERDVNGTKMYDIVLKVENRFYQF